MALFPHLTEKEFGSLDPVLQAEYTKDGEGIYRLDVTEKDGFTLENTSGLRTALARERETARRHEADLKKWKALGETPDAVRAEIDSSKKMGDLPDEKKIEEIREQERKRLAEKHDAERESWAAEKKTLEGELYESIVTQTATTEIVNAGGNPTVLLPHVLRQVRVDVNASGKRVPVVIDPATGNARVSPSPNSSGDMSIGELVGEMKKHRDFQVNFRATDAAGSDSAGGESGGGKEPATDPQLPPTERLKRIRTGETKSA